MSALSDWPRRLAYTKLTQALIRGKGKLNKAVYFGFRYECPFCRSGLRSFAPYGIDYPVLKEKEVVGAGYRRDGRCPVCGTIDRERLLWLYIKHKTSLLSEPARLLHVAPEGGLYPIFRSRSNIDYLTADISGENVMVRMDITDIAYPADSFDAIICSHVLQDVAEDGKAMSELCRVLKPGGWAILQVPVSRSLKETWEDDSQTTPEERQSAFGHPEHVRIYARDFGERLEHSGFSVKVFDWKTEAEVFGGVQNRYALIEDERIYHAFKRART